MEATQISSEFQDIKYQIQFGTDKSKVIFEDQIYIISTIRAKRFAIHKCKKLKRYAARLEKMMLVKKEENIENPLFPQHEITDKSINVIINFCQNQKKKKYKYESRHNHATNRRRDDKGRFISRQQRELEQNQGTPDSPILIPDHDQFSISQELVPTIHNEFDYQLNQHSEPIQEPYPETPWLEKRIPQTPNQQPKQMNQMSNLQLFTPVLGYNDEGLNYNQQQQQSLMGMLPMLPEAQSMKIEEQDQEQQLLLQEKQEPIEGNHILLIDFLEQKIKKEETDSFEEPVNYFDYLKLEPEVANVN